MSSSQTTHLVAALLLAGCPNPNLYSTPRTIDPGKVEWQIAPEFMVVNHPPIGQVPSGPNAHNDTSSSPMQSFGARIGVLNGFDVGVREQDWDALAVDAKIRLFRSRLDFALDPGLQVVPRDSFPVYFHAPVLLGINFSDKLSAVLSPGFVYTGATGGLSGRTGGGLEPGGGIPLSITTGLEPATTVTGAMAQMGLGFDFRITHRLAIHPEVTALKPLDMNLAVWIAGIGFNFGAQPDYSDLMDAPKTPASPVQTPPAAPPPVPPLAPVQPSPAEIVL